VQTAGWRITEDERGPLLEGPRGLVRVDPTVAAVFAGRTALDAGRLVQRTAERVLRRLGALEREPGDGEPLRPPAPEQGPLVSVVIATHDGRDLLAACLRSLAGQLYAPLEIVVVDGGSTDGTGELLRAEHPAVVLVEAPGNPGFAAACNLGVAAASGEHLLLLNNDTTLEPDAIGQLVRVALQSPRRLAAVNAMTRRADLPAVIDSLGNVSGMRGFGAPRYAGFVDFGQFARDGELFSASFTAVLIPRLAWDAVGPLDERYGYYYEDVDWSLRARMGGLHVLPAPHALVYHEGSASVGTRPSAYKLRLVTRNRVLWAGKVLRGRNAAGFTRRYLFEDIERIALAAREGRRKDAAAMATAWLEVAVRAPSIYAARQSLRQWHVVPDENLFRAAATGPPLLDGSLPRVDGPAIRGHYLHLESSLGAED
jgi:N-acetylglucosaminyl-diphospho-decaprenol L-rhamnosyltransferase